MHYAGMIATVIGVIVMWLFSKDIIVSLVRQHAKMLIISAFILIGIFSIYGMPAGGTLWLIIGKSIAIPIENTIILSVAVIVLSVVYSEPFRKTALIKRIAGGIVLIFSLILFAGYQYTYISGFQGATAFVRLSPSIALYASIGMLLSANEAYE